MVHPSCTILRIDQAQQIETLGIAFCKYLANENDNSSEIKSLICLTVVTMSTAANNKHLPYRP